MIQAEPSLLSLPDSSKAIRLVSGPPVLVKRTISGSIRRPHEIVAPQRSAAAEAPVANQLSRVWADGWANCEDDRSAAAGSKQTITVVTDDVFAGNERSPVMAARLYRRRLHRGGARRRQAGLDALGERVDVDAGRCERSMQRCRSGGHPACLVGRQEQHQLADAGGKRGAHRAPRR